MQTLQDVETQLRAEILEEEQRIANLKKGYSVAGRYRKPQMITAQLRSSGKLERLRKALNAILAARG